MAGAATAAALVVLVVDALRTAYVDLPAASANGTAGVTGAALFRTWVLPFEVLSVLLLAALVGAIVLSRSTSVPPDASGGGDDDPDAPPRGSARFGGAG